jgi:hypothetical protein
VHKPSRGVIGECDGWCTKGRAPRVPSRRDGQGAFLRSRRVLSSRVEAPLHTVGGAGGCKGAVRGAAPSAPLPGCGRAAHRSREAPGAQPPLPPCRGRGPRRPTVPPKRRGAGPDPLKKHSPLILTISPLMTGYRWVSRTTMRL